MSAFLQKALEYAEKGLAVFPLKPQDKIPATKDGFKSATRDKDQIRKWWNKNPNYNIGIATGKVSGGVFVIDVDLKEDVNGAEALSKWEDEHGNLPITATSLTGSGGYHYLFRSDKEVRNTTNLYTGVDIRGDGGYIVAPPSIHPNGNQYEWVSETGKVGITDANDLVMQFLAGDKTGNKSKTKTEKVSETIIKKGQRVNVLFRMCSGMVDKGFSEPAIRAAINAENNAKCIPPLTEKELEREVFGCIHRYDSKNPYSGEAMNTVGAQELYHKEIPPIQWFVEKILPTGTNMLAAPPKTNKSWFALAAGLAIAKGERFLGFNTEKAGVLYLALEDSERRLQDRMMKLLKGTYPPENLHFTTKARTINTGLLEDLNSFLKEFPDVRFVIIDTLQKIRDVTSNKDVYGRDYKELGALQDFGKDHNIAFLIIHHTRKAKDADVFSNIAGTNGILGAVDTAIVFTKEKREDTKILMDVTGRDVSSETYELEFENYSFRFLGTAQTIAEQMADFEYRHNPIVKTIKELLNMSPDGNYMSPTCHSASLTCHQKWEGTSTELQAEIMKHGQAFREERSLGKELKNLQEALFHKDNIVYEYKRYNNKRLHSFYINI